MADHQDRTRVLIREESLQPPAPSCFTTLAARPTSFPLAARRFTARPSVFALGIRLAA